MYNHISGGAGHFGFLDEETKQNRLGTACHVCYCLFAQKNIHSNSDLVFIVT